VKLLEPVSSGFRDWGTENNCLVLKFDLEDSLGVNECASLVILEIDELVPPLDDVLFELLLEDLLDAQVEALDVEGQVGALLEGELIDYLLNFLDDFLQLLLVDITVLQLLQKFFNLICKVNQGVDCIFEAQDNLGKLLGETVDSGLVSPLDVQAIQQLLLGA